jgi:hypothetical protein
MRTSTTSTNHHSDECRKSTAFKLLSLLALPERLNRRSFFLSSITFMAALILSISTTAQTPASCNSGCTSNDVQIIGAYLSDANGNALTNYVCGSGVAVYLSLQLTTNTPRKGVSIYSDIQPVVNGVPATGAPAGTVSQCFGNDLNTATNVVTFTNAVNWTCGQQIALVGTYTAWGTGNKNFCTGGTFQCGGTPSKCHAAQAGEIIIIQVPQTGSASDTKCSSVAGSYNATFNLTSYKGTIISNAANYNFTYYTDADLASNHLISDSTAFVATAASTTVYAKVCEKAHPDACSPAAITLTVKPKPSTPSPANNGPICAGLTLNLSVDAVANATYGWTGPNSFTSAAQNPSISNATVAATGTYNLNITVDGCASAQGTTGATVNAQPATPTLRITQQPSLCSSSTGSVEVCSPNSNYTYTISVNNAAFGNPQTGTTISFGDLAAGSAPVIKVSNGTSGCYATQSCANAVATCPNPANATRMATDTYQSIEKIVVEETTKVLAYPNPFSNKVNFVITSSVAGRGNLEVFNMLGQKVKTVYQGLFTKGIQTFELNLSRQQLSNLVYVLRIGDKKLTGKLLQQK